MAIILLPTGSIYQFTDGETGIYQFAGTHDAFARTILGRFDTLSSSTASFNGTTTLNGLINNSAAVKHDYLRVRAVLYPTTSLTNPEQFLFSGSFIASRGDANHMLVLGSMISLYNYTVNYIKFNNNSNLICVSSSAGINGQTQWSSSDAYASIQLVYAEASPLAEWIITSRVGNWA